MSNKYITKAELLEWIQVQVPKVTNIPDRFMTKGHALVDRTLINMRVYDIPTKVDDLGFLKEAASCFILALACKARVITQTSGELLTDAFGEVKYQFQRTQPMFFFAQGTAESFQRLLPHETLRMMAIDFCKGYKQYYIFYSKRDKQKIPKGIVVRDKTSRGNYWNEYVSDIENADAEFGDYVPEGESGFKRETEPNWTEWT